MQRSTMYGGLVLRQQIRHDLIARDNVDLLGYGGVLRTSGRWHRLRPALSGDFWILFYNRDLLTDSSAYPTNDMTWDEFRAAKLLTSGEGADKTYGTYIHVGRTYFVYGLQKHIGNLVEGPYEMLRDGLGWLINQMVDKSAADYATNRAMGAHYHYCSTGYRYTLHGHMVCGTSP